MSYPTRAFWVVGAIVTAVLAAFLAVAAMCFYRRNAFHEERKQFCLQAVRRTGTTRDRGGITLGHRKKKSGRGAKSASRISPSAPPSPAAAAIPVLVAGPHHYYTDPTKYTYDSFYAATTPVSAQEDAVELSTLPSSVSQISTDTATKHPNAAEGGAAIKAVAT